MIGSNTQISLPPVLLFVFIGHSHLTRSIVTIHVYYIIRSLDNVIGIDKKSSIFSSKIINCDKFKRVSSYSFTTVIPIEIIILMVLVTILCVYSRHGAIN